jgi:3-hydroxyacyl-CoA dehydrogenase
MESKKGLTLDSKIVRNRLVNDHFQNALKSKPSPIYSQKFASRITTGNTTDDIAKLANVDWIIEVVVERLDIKKMVFEQIEKYRKPGTLITSNTSGIPIHFMSEGRSEDFQKHFCGTHFFNPARYLKLFEIIPGPQTSTEFSYHIRREILRKNFGCSQRYSCFHWKPHWNLRNPKFISLG